MDLRERIFAALGEIPDLSRGIPETYIQPGSFTFITRSTEEESANLRVSCIWGVLPEETEERLLEMRIRTSEIDSEAPAKIHRLAQDSISWPSRASVFLHPGWKERQVEVVIVNESAVAAVRQGWGTRWESNDIYWSEELPPGSHWTDVDSGTWHSVFRDTNLVRSRARLLSFIDGRETYGISDTAVRWIWIDVWASALGTTFERTSLDDSGELRRRGVTFVSNEYVEIHCGDYLERVMRTYPDSDWAESIAATWLIREGWCSRTPLEFLSMIRKGEAYLQKFPHSSARREILWILGVAQQSAARPLDSSPEDLGISKEDVRDLERNRETHRQAALGHLRAFIRESAPDEARQGEAMYRIWMLEHRRPLPWADFLDYGGC